MVISYAYGTYKKRDKEFTANVVYDDGSIDRLRSEIVEAQRLSRALDLSINLFDYNEILNQLGIDRVGVKA